MNSFTDISAHLKARLASGDRVLLILLDAFGRCFLEQYRDHPLVRRLAVTPLSSQFPSTTTAHITSLHFGLPVSEHGLYEWSVYEPTLDRIIQPLPFRLAGDNQRDGLDGTLDPRCLIDAPTCYETLGMPSRVVLPAGLCASAYSRHACRGTDLTGSDDLAGSVRSLVAALAAEEIGFGYVYWPEIDAMSHLYGPESTEVRSTILQTLDAIEAGLEDASGGVTVMFTADHGQTSVSPDRLDALDLIWPELADHLSQARPAGSTRDVFLHVQPGAVDTVMTELAERLGGRASVHRAADLFETVGPRLAARLADVAVLPVQGRCAWLSTAPTNAMTHLGSHGGLSEAETATYLAELLT